MKKTALGIFEEKLYEFETLYESLPTKLYEYLSDARVQEEYNIKEAYLQGRFDEETRFPFATDEDDYFNKKFTQSSE